MECRPHALHSIDPMAGVDIREVKRLVGDKVCLCGNVHCAALQTGTDEEAFSDKAADGDVWTVARCEDEFIPVSEIVKFFDAVVKAQHLWYNNWQIINT